MFAIRTGDTLVRNQKISSVNAVLKIEECQCPNKTLYEEGMCKESFCDEYDGCFNGGVCIGINKCNCTEEYEGAQCEKVKCKDGWMGEDCSITHCFGYTSNLEGVCSGRGKCISPNKCICEDGYKGHKCQRVWSGDEA